MRFLLRHTLPIVVAAALTMAAAAGGQGDCDVCGDPAIGYHDPSAPVVDLTGTGCIAKAHLSEEMLVVPNDYYVPAPLRVTFNVGYHEALNSKVWIVGYC